MRSIRIAMAQMNPTVGDLSGNVRRITGWIREARRARVDVVAFPELAITGYPPEDLLFNPRFLDETYRALKMVAAEASGLVVVVGYVGRGTKTGPLPDPSSLSSVGRHDLYNAAAAIHEDTVAKAAGLLGTSFAGMVAHDDLAANARSGAQRRIAAEKERPDTHLREPAASGQAAAQRRVQTRGVDRRSRARDQRRHRRGRQVAADDLNRAATQVELVGRR